MPIAPQAANDRAAVLSAAVSALQPTLAANAATGRAARRLPAANTQALRAAGLCGVYSPCRFGGDELHMTDVLPLVTQVAEVCPASAWVLAIYQIHNWLIALFPEQTQQDVFAHHPDPLVCASLNPSKNAARKVADGYLIERARFTFCSGAAAREWALCGVVVKNTQEEVVDVGCLLVPGETLTELDDWQVSGLQATGSLSLLAEQLWVPAHRFLSYAHATQSSTAGARVNPGALYQAAFVPMLVLNLAGPALGAAEAAWRYFVSNLTALGAQAGAFPLPGLTRIDAAATHAMLATTRLQIDSARLLLGQAAQSIRAQAEAGHPLPPVQAAKVNLETSHAVRECLAAVQALFLQAGGAVLHPGHPLQDAYQDVAAINCHGFLAHEANLTLYGSLLTGHAHPSAFL